MQSEMHTVEQGGEASFGMTAHEGAPTHRVDEGLPDAFVGLAAQGAGGLLGLVAPSLHRALRRLRAGLQRVDPAAAPFEVACVERLLVPRLSESVMSMLEPTLVLELAVARVQERLHGDTPEDRFASFCAGLRTPEGRRAIEVEYPELMRAVDVRCVQWADSATELLQRLAHDWPLLRARFTAGLEPGVDPGALVDLDIGAGDTHRGGRSVAILEFASGWRIVYKPRSMAVDLRFAELLRWIDRDGSETPFRVLGCIDRGEYGWSEFVARESCTEPAQVERFYRRLGGLLAVFQVTRGRDLHYGNLIASGEHPMPVDLEALFHNDAENDRADPALVAFEQSVMQTMLLPQPMITANTGQLVDLSAFGARSDQPYPFAERVRWDRPGTDEMRLVRDDTVPTLVARSRPCLNGVEVDAEDYAPAFLAGFERVYRIVEAGRDALLADGGWCDRIADAEVRFIARATAEYAGMLARCNQPRALRSADARADVFAPLSTAIPDQPHLERFVAAEVHELQRGDVPRFTSRPGSCDVWTSDGECIPGVFAAPATASIRAGLRRLGDADLARQIAIVRSTIVALELAPGEVSPSRTIPPACCDTPLALARAIGDRLCASADQDDVHASWLGVDPMGPCGEVSVEPVDLGLYAGLAGCSMFLAQLGAATGEHAYEAVARKAVALLRHRLRRGPAGMGLGAFTGLGGLVYTFTHLGVLWDDVSCIADAHRLVDEVPELVAHDTMLDVIGGAAGAIAALGVLHRVDPTAAVRDAAIRCGEHLLAKQTPQPCGAAWTTSIGSSQPLTGFSHGAAGIAWALFELSAMTGERRFAEAARAALAYERSTFVEHASNWPDFRLAPGKDPAVPCCELAWCHGAPGIAMGRMASLRHDDDREARHEIAIALHTTLAAPRGRNHCLCHGDFGTIEVLLQAAECMGGDWRAAAQAVAAQTLASIAEHGCRCGGQTYLAAPGLMTGLAGIGYGALRLARPEVPSVLRLAPP